MLVHILANDEKELHIVLIDIKAEW